MEGVSLLGTSSPRNPKRNETPMRGGSPNSYIQSPRSCPFHARRLSKQLHFISQTSLPRDLTRNGTPMRGGSPNNHILSSKTCLYRKSEESVAPFKVMEQPCAEATPTITFCLADHVRDEFGILSSTLTRNGTTISGGSPNS